MIFQSKHLIFMMGNINEMQEVKNILFPEYDYINIPLNQRIPQSIQQKTIHMTVCKNDINLSKMPCSKESVRKFHKNDCTFIFIL